MRSALATLLLLASMAVAPAAAIENAQFGMEPATEGGNPRTELRIGIRAGRTSTDRLVLRNLSGQPLTLRLSAVPATIDAAGQVRLEGDQSVPGWFRFEDPEVNLAPGGQRVVEVSVRVPRKIPGGIKTAAVVAEPVAPPGTTPVVVQRLALRTFLEPDSGSLIASLGILPWVAAALLVVVSGVAVLLRRRRRL